VGKGKYQGRRAGAFIFDLDGTLVDSGRDIADSANFVRGHFDLPALPPETMISYVGDGVEMLLRRALTHEAAAGGAVPETQEVEPGRLAEAMEVFRGHYSRHLLDTTKLYPGVLDILMRYRAYPLLLATNKPRDFTDAICAGLGIKAAFANIIAGDETPARKPDPEHLRRVLVSVEVEPSMVVMVGDSPNDILAGKALGAMTVGCTYGLVAESRVRASGPDHTIAAIAELASLYPSR